MAFLTVKTSFGNFFQIWHVECRRFEGKNLMGDSKSLDLSLI